MSAIQSTERPVFNTIEPGLDIDLTPPISGLAILAMLLGIFSLTAALTTSVVPFAVVVAVLCAVLIWKLSWDSTVSGMRLAQIGLCCAIFGATWGLTATRFTEAYYYAQAGEHAKLFLKTLSDGKQFNAFELTQPEPNRQVTGTDIEAHYKGLLSASLPVRTEVSKPEEMPSGETMKSSHSKEELEEFLTTSSTKEIMSHGKDANWELVRGGGVVRMSSTVNRVSVVMIDKANSAKKYQVDLNRVVGQMIAKPGTSSVAIWDVDRTKVVKE
jgi:hypothetical protein